MSNKASAISSENDWRARSDMSTLVEAEQIRNDPKRLKAALAQAKKQAADLASVTDEAAEEKGEKKPAKK